MFVSARGFEAFYASPQGQKLAQDCAAALARAAPPNADDTVLGFGFTRPYLAAFAPHCRAKSAFMPAALAAEEAEDGAAEQDPALEEGRKFPLADASIDCILAVHALEFCPDAQAMLRELWRVLAPNGRLVLAVPNRRSLWTHTDKTPFGHGEPYSRGQLAQMLAGNGFECASIREYAHFWPGQSRRAGLFAKGYERLARRFFPYFGGALLAEAHKRAYKPIAAAKTERRAAFLADLVPQPARLKPQSLCRKL